MNNPRSFVKRLLLAGGLSLGVLATAALSGPAAGADPTPPRLSGGILNIAPISAIQVQPGGHQATVSFTTAEPTTVTIDHKPVTAMAATRQPTVQAFDGMLTGVPVTPRPLPVTIFDGQFHATRTYATAHDLKLTGLTSNTAYDVSVTAETRSGQRLTAQTRFTTLKRRIRVTLESIDVKDDGDGFLSGKGEPLWHVLPTWDGASYNSPYNGGALCYPNDYGRCEYGEYGKGLIPPPRNSKGEPLTLVFAEENFDRFPGTVSLRVWAVEDDAIGGAQIIECVTGGCPVGEDAVSREWRVPQGVESYSQRITVPGDDSSTGFESVLTFHFELFHDNLSYPWHTRNLPSNTWFPGVPVR